MLKAIIYKEWLKTRGVFLIGLLLSVCMAGFEILSMNRVGTVKGVEHIWQIMLMKDNMFVNHLTFIPLAVGVGVGLAQMLPEMVQKRFKLTLHLPYSQNRMVLAMLAVGLAEIVVVSVVTSVIVVVYDMRVLAPELVSRVVLTMSPWFVAGVVAYFSPQRCVLKDAESRRWRCRCLESVSFHGFLPAMHRRPTTACCCCLS